VSAWITPALAAVFWAGLLAQPLIGDVVDPWIWLSAGGGLLGAALALAAGPAEDTGSLERAGLVERDPRAAVAPAPIRHDRPVWVPLALALIGAVLLAVGWGSVHEHRVRGAVVARLARANVTVEGPLRVDPSAERDR
jgi:drug/metabolite transporter (DMT)-like permease